mmetsp:Transcript_10940/g.19822  ORF Transcript_10940/g.19822 Transcript_10940/m.19822 type:complete len:223 (+) Transcript_10940:194-862(+)
MSSATIELRANAASGCCPNPNMFAIERTMPAVMNGYVYMISHEWEEFCNRVNDALERMAKASRIAMYTFWFNALACIVAVAVFMAVFLNHNIYDIGLSLLPIVIVPVVVVVSFIGTGTSCYWAVIGQRVKQSIIPICEDTSNGNSSLSFHFREETYVTGYGDNRSSKCNWYIDISISQDAVAAAVGAPSESAAKRLEDLEAVKSMLSPEEYDEKRARIVAEL